MIEVAGCGSASRVVARVGGPIGKRWDAQPPRGSAPQPTNNAATVGFILGISAAVLSIIPVLGTISWLLAPVAIVFAIVGLNRATPSRGAVGRGTAIWGIVLGVLALIICSFYVTAIARAAHTTTPSSTYSAPSYTAPAPSYTYTPPSYSSGSSSGSGSSSSGGSYTAPAADPNTFSAGTYEVGTEIQPGTSRTTGSSYCYYARLENLDDSIDSIIGNDNVQGQGIMKVASSDKYVEFSGTCTWTKK